MASSSGRGSSIVAHSGSFGDQELEDAVGRYTNVVFVDVSHTAVTEAGLRALGKAHGATLTTLLLERCHRVDDSTLSSVSQTCTQLQHVSLRGLGIVGRGAVDLALANAATLTELNLRSTPVSDDAVSEVVGAASRLTRLNISHCDELTDASLAAIGSSVPGLVALRANRLHQLSDEGIDSLSRGCSSLTSLSVSHCASVTNVGLEMLAARLPHLVELRVDSCYKISDVGVLTLASRCTELREISLVKCFKVSQAAVDELFRLCPHLTTVRGADQRSDAPQAPRTSAVHARSKGPAASESSKKELEVRVAELEEKNGLLERRMAVLESLVAKVLRRA